MSMVTHSTKRDRIYERAFDHDEARSLREAGWSYGRLAEHFGVSETAVQRVCKPALRKRQDEQTKKWIKENRREPCRGGCGRLVWMMSKGRTGLCQACLAEQLAADGVRPEELLCRKCGAWKPDEEFTRQERRTRRGRRSWCRGCETEARRRHRATHEEQERKTSREYKRRGKPMSKFVVLRKEQDGRWAEHERVRAASRMAAVEQTADGEGVYAAVSEGQLREFPVREAVAFRIVKDADVVDLKERAVS